MIEYYRQSDFKRTQWSGGVSTELFIMPESSSYKERTFSIRLSSATIELPTSSFTHLEGIKRFITPITHPVLLEVNREKPFLLHPFKVFEFSGEDEVKSYGMTVDFNLMLDERHADGWMKTLIKHSPDEKNEANISLSAEEIFWIFSYFPSQVIVNDNLKTMEAFSLLMLKNTHSNVAFSSNENLLYGCIKAF